MPFPWTYKEITHFARAQTGVSYPGLERVPAQQLTPPPFTVTQPFTEPPRVPSHTFPIPGEFYRDKRPLPSESTWHSWEEGESTT